MNDGKKLKEIDKNRRSIPLFNDLPVGGIDWEEISEFILTDMNMAGLFWHFLEDESKTARLAENSLTVLKLIRRDMYDFFYCHDVELERFDQWVAMEKYVRKKYAGLSEKALSRLVSDYKINDR